MIKLFSDLIRGRLFGHPVHMMLVHFPSAFFPVSLIADLIAIFFNDNNFHLFSFYAAVAGITIGWLALVFGLIDLLKISSDNKAFKIVLLHGGLNFLWLTIFSILIALEIKNYPIIEYSLIKLILKTFIVTGILFSNWLGGELVLKYGIGKKE